MAQRFKSKVERVMREFHEGRLRSGSPRGRKVTTRKQAIAIGLSEARAAGEHVGPRGRRHPPKGGRT